MSLTPMRQVYALVIGLAVLAGCGPTRAASSNEKAPHEREVASERSEEVLAPRRLTDDGRWVERTIGAVRSKLDARFGPDVARSVDAAHVTVYVHGSPNALASEGQATIITRQLDDGYLADVHLLALSAHRPEFRTKLGNKMGRRYMHKLIVHELSTVYLERMTLAKQRGWRLFDAPAWFYQGLEEYLALEVAPPKNPDRSWDQLREHTVACVGPEAEESLPVCDPYIQGAMIIRFIVDTHGFEKIKRLLQNDSDTFEQALREVLHVNSAQLGERWQRSLQ